MSQYIHKSHNVSVLLYHLVCPAKYRRVVFDAQVDAVLREICLEIADRYEITFLEIGTDRDHVHFLVCAFSGAKRSLLQPLTFGATHQEFDGP
jgi:REP element-mobilizing transposase RayT